MRVGLLYPTRDPLSPGNWSGTPQGLRDGFASLGIEVVPVGARLPIGMHQAVAVLSRAGGKRGAAAERTLIRQWSRTWALSRSLEAAGELDALVAMGTEMYDLAAVRSPSIPVATYDDATLMQMWRHPNADIRQLGYTEQEVLRWFDRQGASSRAADVCCASTEWAAHSLVDDYSVEADRVRVIGIGHRPRRHVDAFARDWSSPRFLFIGVDWIRKNGDAVLRAFSELRRDVPDATLDVVGQHPKLNIRGVKGHGFLQRQDRGAQAVLDALFETATAFVLPSRFEPAGIAYLEAASAGLPVVVTTEGGARELLGGAAIAVHPDDGPALLSAMRRLSDASVAQQLGEKAAHHAATASWSHIAARILRALRIQLPATGNLLAGEADEASKIPFA